MGPKLCPLKEYRHEDNRRCDGENCMWYLDLECAFTVLAKMSVAQAQILDDFKRKGINTINWKV